jgi:hypothetical protein
VRLPLGCADFACPSLPSHSLGRYGRFDCGSALGEPKEAMGRRSAREGGAAQGGNFWHVLPLRWMQGFGCEGRPRYLAFLRS